ncbi:HPr kinase/phosphorylase [Bartonella sp. DGB2]|uniref:HPr kinase/phosphorylase n=1 Tax=Bartonella sp. DGB2 TaxID=3388426 RepID=UPI00398FC84A
MKTVRGKVSVFTELSQGGLVHGNCLEVAGRGFLLLGESGAGKSTLSLSLIERAGWAGRAAFLISDDYTHLFVEDSVIYAQGAGHLRGAIEIRGAGLYKIAAQEKTKLYKVIWLHQEKAQRYPDDEKIMFGDVSLPLLYLPPLGYADAIALCHAIEAFCFGEKWSEGSEKGNF